MIVRERGKECIVSLDRICYHRKIEYILEIDCFIIVIKILSFNVEFIIKGTVIIVQLIFTFPIGYF